MRNKAKLENLAKAAGVNLGDLKVSLEAPGEEGTLSASLLRKYVRPSKEGDEDSK